MARPRGSNGSIGRLARSLRLAEPRDEDGGGTTGVKSNNLDPDGSARSLASVFSEERMKPRNSLLDLSFKLVFCKSMRMPRDSEGLPSTDEGGVGWDLPIGSGRIKVDRDV